MNKIIKLLEKLEIKTKNLALYIEALTHNSYAVNKPGCPNYQRLEFLGDAIIAKIVSCYLYYLDLDEASMTEQRKIIVKSDTLLMASEEYDLISYANIGKTIDPKAGNERIKGDLFESLMGAVYLDHGEIKVFDILKRTILKYFEEKTIKQMVDYKTKMQEFFQDREVAKNATAKHDYIHSQENCMFRSKLVFDGKVYGEGVGKTKREADFLAAEQAYYCLVDKNPKKDCPKNKK